MDTKLSFRARSMDPSKPLQIYRTEELENKDGKSIVRLLRKIPSGMEKKEECEIDLIRAISSGGSIPVPEVEVNDDYEQLYPCVCQLSNKLIMTDASPKEDTPEYDIDSEDELFIESQQDKLGVSVINFEKMIELFEKKSTCKVITLDEAILFFSMSQVEVISVYEYWLNKRLTTRSPLIMKIPTTGKGMDNCYVAFRKRFNRRITRRNRKSDEASFYKMLRLKKDLYRAVSLLQMIKEREELKRESIRLQEEIFRKRIKAEDYDGDLVSDIRTQQRSCLLPRMKRKYRRSRKANEINLTIDESLEEDDGPFSFKRKAGCSYYKPTSFFSRAQDEENSYEPYVLPSNKRYLVRKRLGRGGRIIFDRRRIGDEFWSNMDYNIYENNIKESCHGERALQLPENFEVEVEDLEGKQKPYRSVIDMNCLNMMEDTSGGSDSLQKTECVLKELPINEIKVDMSTLCFNGNWTNNTQDYFKVRAN